MEIIFNEKSIKKIKKNLHKDKIELFNFFEELSTFIRENNNFNQVRKFTKYKQKELFDILEHHKKLRIIAILKEKEKIFIENILFDHLGKDKTIYENYWEGKEELDLKPIKKIKKEEIFKLKEKKDINLINKYLLE